MVHIIGPSLDYPFLWTSLIVVLEEVLPATFNTIQFPLSNPPCLTLKYRAAGWDCLLIADNIWYRLLLPSLLACCLLLLRWKQATATSLQRAPACTLHPPAYNHKRLKMQRNAISNIKNPCISVYKLFTYTTYTTTYNKEYCRLKEIGLRKKPTKRKRKGWDRGEKEEEYLKKKRKSNKCLDLSCRKEDVKQSIWLPELAGLI